MTERSWDRNPWWVGTLCGLALVVTWVCCFSVYSVLPAQTPGAHWALFFLALGSTLGLIFTFERVLAPWSLPRDAAADKSHELA